jgi:DNA-binding winged helix-turn-helix (wHTH) protein
VGFRLGPWRVDPAACELRADDRTVRLRPKVMDLLTALADRPGEVWTKPELLDAVWPDVVVTEASLSVAVAELRDALGDQPSHPTFIETIPRRGYRLIAAVLGGPRPLPESPSTTYSLVGRSLTIALDHGRIVIGRDPECDVRLDSHHASRFHAAVEVVGDRVLVEDLGSKNGTFVGDRRIEAATEIRPGDRVRFGRHAATLQLASDDSATWTDLSEVRSNDEESAM